MNSEEIDYAEQGLVRARRFSKPSKTILSELKLNNPIYRDEKIYGYSESTKCITVVDEKTLAKEVAENLEGHHIIHVG